MQRTNVQRGLALIIAALLLGGGLLFVNRILYADSFNREEAQHALYGLWIYKDIKVLDWQSFWYDTQRQMFWPFLHSWLLAVTYLLFGVSYVSSRLLSLLIFAATLWLMYLSARRVSEDSGGRIGLIAILLALSSPIAVRFAVENTLEGLGALIFMASFYYYTICEQRKLFYEYLILGVLIGLSIYTNYLYAYLMIPAFVLATVSRLGPLFVQGIKLETRGEKAALPFLWWAYKKLIVLGVLLIFAASWFLTAAFSRKIMLLLQAVFRYSGGEPVAGFWSGLLFYPRAIIDNYFFSPWLGWLAVLLLVAPFAGNGFRQMNKIYIFVWTVLLLATLTVPGKAPQFICIIFPFIFLIAAASFVYWLDRLKKYSFALSLFVLVPALVSLPVLGGLYFPKRPAENFTQVLQYFKLAVQPRHALAASLNLPRLNPEGIAFYFWDWNAPVLADPLVGEDEMFRGARYFLTVEIGPDGSYPPQLVDDSLYRWNIFLANKLKAGAVREYSSRTFSGLGLTARIYEKL